MVAVLLERKASIEAIDCDGNTILMLAAQSPSSNAFTIVECGDPGGFGPTQSCHRFALRECLVTKAVAELKCRRAGPHFLHLYVKLGALIRACLLPIYHVRCCPCEPFLTEMRCVPRPP